MRQILTGAEGCRPGSDLEGDPYFTNGEGRKEGCMNGRLSSLLERPTNITLAVLMDALFDLRNPDEALRKLAQVIPELINLGDDEGLNKLIAVKKVLLGEKFLKSSIHACREKSAILSKDFIDLYLKLPEKEIKEGNSLPTAAFPESKCHILRTLGDTWCGTSREETDIEIFRFFLAAYSMHDRWVINEDTPHYEKKMNRRVITHKERLEIENSFRNSLAEKKFSLARIEEWMNFDKKPGESSIPEELRRIFQIEWLKKGGSFDEFFAQRDRLAEMEVMNDIVNDLSFCSESGLGGLDGWHVWVRVDKKDDAWIADAYFYACATKVPESIVSSDEIVELVKKRFYNYHQLESVSEHNLKFNPHIIEGRVIGS